MPHPLVTFSAHAQDRMRQRAIAKSQVLDVLANPDRVFVGRHGNPIAEKAIGSATMRIVFVDRIGPNGWHTHVVTVMWK